jgi:dienelactone hydrolase
MEAIQDHFSRRFSDGGDNPSKDLRSYTCGPSEANAVVDRCNALSEDDKQAMLNFPEIAPTSGTALSLRRPQGEEMIKHLGRFVVLIVMMTSGTVLASTDPFVGSWVLSAKPSTYPLGTCPMHMVIEINSVANGIRYRSDATYVNGRTAHSEYNGRQTLVVGTRGLLLPVSLKRLDARMVVASYMKGLEVQSSPPSTQAPIIPEIVELPSGALHLKGYLWKPAGPGPFPAVMFNHGSGAKDAQHTAGRTMAEAAADLAPVFLKHGYVFFYLCRRGQGLSADQGPFAQDLLEQAEAKGPEARKHVHYQLVTGGQLDDALAGLAFLKAVPSVDPKRIAVVGHSFGGMLTLLSGEHDSSIRAEVSFAAGAKSWHTSQELRQSTLASVDKTAAPIMLVQAANDFDTTSSTEIAAELNHLHKPHQLKIYPPVGETSEDGHNLLYLAIPEWEPDVFQFLDGNLKR